VPARPPNDRRTVPRLTESRGKVTLMTRFLTLLTLVALPFLAVRFLEGRAIFFPVKPLAALPSAYGLRFEDVYFETTDRQKLNAWYLPGREGAKVFLFCHGNAGNISHRIEKLAFLNGLGYGVLILDYRGYGNSEGRPGEQGFYRDAEAAYDYLRSRGVPPERITGYGESIGGSVVAHLATRRSLGAVIFENSFTNIGDMARAHYPVIPPWILASRFDTREAVASLKVPKLFIRSREDKIVPPRLGADLFRAAADPKESLEIRGGHNDGFFESKDLIGPRLREFLGE